MGNQDSFDAFYGSLFGERWIPLKESLLRPVRYIPFQETLKKPYFLNLASYAGVRALGETGNRKVLDLCAAPGGKTLVLASSLGPEGLIVANERSRDRRYRLKRVLEEHLPEEKLRQVRITGKDARQWGLGEKDTYDLVLLDAPCSSERHLLENPSHLKRWSPHRTRSLAQQAYAMAISALLALKPGGLLAYCTCALSPLENDAVIERVLTRKKKNEDVRATLLSFHLEGQPFKEQQSTWEPTLYGFQMFPDRAEGAGPLYIAFLRKQPPD